MSLESLKRKLSRRVDALSRSLWALSREIHAHPELSFEERQSADRIAAYLAAQGFRIERGLAGLPTSFRASWGRPGRPAVAFLAEYDALPGLGHACGHNVIAAASVGAACALASLGEGVRGRVSVLGTPAEEVGGGKVILAERGVFEGYDAALMVHPSDRTRAQVQFLALQELQFHFRGVPAHAAASPERGVNALDAVIQTFNAISALRQQLPDDVRIHGVITGGGRAPNIIPERAGCWFYVRCAAGNSLDGVVAKVVDCARGAARATGAKLRVVRSGARYEPMRLNETLAGLFRASLERLGEAEPEEPAPPAMGSSDVGNVSQRLPAIHPELRMVHPGVACHTPAFEGAAGSAPGRRVMVLGAKALAMTALEVMADPRKRRRVWSEFRGRGGRG